MVSNSGIVGLGPASTASPLPSPIPTAVPLQPPSPSEVSLKFANLHIVARSASGWLIAAVIVAFLIGAGLISYGKSEKEGGPIAFGTLLVLLAGVVGTFLLGVSIGQHQATTRLDQVLMKDKAETAHMLERARQEATIEVLQTRIAAEASARRQYLESIRVTPRESFAWSSVAFGVMIGAWPCVLLIPLLLHRRDPPIQRMYPDDRFPPDPPWRR